MLEFGALIAGRVTAGGPFLDVVNPANGTVFARVRNATDEDLRTAVDAARAAAPGWRALTPQARAGHLIRAAAILHAHAAELAELQTREQGKTFHESMIEVGATAHWFASAGTIPFPSAEHESSEARHNRTIYEPLGVVAAIVPWNVPLLQIGFKLPLALYAGNCVILKPSPFTPAATLRLAELLADVFPAGVLNVLAGDDSFGPRLTAHPGIDKISFTGSTATGKKIMAGAAQGLVRVTLELGGNDPAIVLNDVDIEDTARAIFGAACRNSGQLCVAAKRIFVMENIYESFAAALAAEAAKVRLGDGMEPETTMGPIQNRPQFERLAALAEKIREEGTVLIKDGGPVEGAGFFFEPMILDNPPDESPAVREEQFGPIIPLLRVATAEEAIERANDSEYGLAASIWTKDLDRAAAIASRLDAGTVWVNEIFHFAPTVPFGGHKSSGIGSESGIDGLKAFLQPKTISINRGPLR